MAVHAPETGSAALSLEGVRARSGHFRLGGGDPIDLALAPGDVLAVLGPSGSGKSTLLDVVAGFLGVDEGVVRIGGLDVSSKALVVPPERRGVALLVQDLGLFGHADARANVRAATTARVPPPDALLDRVGFRGERGVPVTRLSGGERQRVALARALASSAPLLLLDEPGAHLDAASRRSVAEAVREALREAGRTTVVASHERSDVLGYAPDVLAVLEDGALLAAGRTEELLRRPGTRRVAERLGFDVFLPARRDGDVVRCALGNVTAPGPVGEGPLEFAWLPGGVRALPRPAVGAPGVAGGRVTSLGFGVAGPLVEVEVETDGARARLRAVATRPFREGDFVSLEWTAPTVVSRE